MAVHKSLKSKDVLKRQRNVLNRWERIQDMREREVWDGERSVYGLPKVRVQAQRKRVKVKKDAAEGEAAPGAAAAAAPAAAAKPAAGAKSGAKPGAAGKSKSSK